MAHFAKLDENNTVIDVNVIDNEIIQDEKGIEHEALGVAFLIQWSGGYPHWKQTSYNRKFRKNYAGIGFTYDPTRDAFIPEKPFPSWVLDEETCIWTAPIPCPTGDGQWAWDEQSQSWVEIFN